MRPLDERATTRDAAVRPAGAAHRDHAGAGAAARRLLHDAGVPGAVEHQRQQPAPRDREPDAAGGAGPVVHQRRTASCRSARPASTPATRSPAPSATAATRALDPMRQFWATQLDFNDRNDFPARSTFNGGAAESAARRRPAARSRSRRQRQRRGHRSVRPAAGAGHRRAGWRRRPSRGSRIAVAQKLCFFANSRAVRRDRSRVPARRRRVRAAASFNFAEPGQASCSRRRW